MSYNPNNPNGQTTSSNSVPVVIASDQSILPISVTSLPLPTGGSTSANQTTEITALNQLHSDLIAPLPAGTNNIGVVTITSNGIPTSLGQQAAATSQPVTLSNEDIQDLYMIGQSAQTAIINNILPTTASTNATDLTGYRSFSVQVISTGTAGSYIFEGSNDNINFVSIVANNQISLTGGPNVGVITATASQNIFVGSLLCRYFRLRIVSTITGGTIQAFSKFSQVSFTPTAFTVANNTAGNLNATAIIASGTITTVSTLSNTTQLTPGVSATNLGKAEDAASVNGDTGVFVLGIREDILLSTTSANGDYIQFTTDKYGSLIVKDQYRHKITYSLSFSVTAATTPTDIFQLVGSSTKSVMLQKINISGTQTTGGQVLVNISKRSTANTAGTSTASIMIPHDSADASATAVGSIYTANPTIGTPVGNIRTFSLPLGAITSTTNNIVQLDFGERGKPIVLTGVAQAIAINLGGATTTGAVINVWMEFTEE